ncbi:hypothetical protein QBC35DRAFT_134643 [Podospora australis]|uniref:Secreted protein n=1 Tax=Podospora australis TaxID=1536484 RepID=A0AAN6WWY4_9PEZI|nr:hypothetical protein QBC35DRAFT_134643 [Podospora australis]
MSLPKRTSLLSIIMAMFYELPVCTGRIPTPGWMRISDKENPGEGGPMKAVMKRRRRRRLRLLIMETGGKENCLQRGKRGFLYALESIYKTKRNDKTRRNRSTCMPYVARCVSSAKPYPRFWSGRPGSGVCLCLRRGTSLSKATAPSMCVIGEAICKVLTEAPGVCLCHRRGSTSIQGSDRWRWRENIVEQILACAGVITRP